MKVIRTEESMEVQLSGMSQALGNVVSTPSVAETIQVAFKVFDDPVKIVPFHTPCKKVGMPAIFVRVRLL
eukprot:m.225997 g.225997  ORF g.225997 m.225997 type:complete len:70 (-) comp26395_c2_seq4:472-681(-)